MNNTNMATPTHYCTLLPIKDPEEMFSGFIAGVSFLRHFCSKILKSNIALEYVKVKTMIYGPPEEGIYLHV